MSEVFVGSIQPFGFQFAPRNWMICTGAILPTQQYQALFALIQNTYGGNGVTNFAIPDTRGRALLGQGRSYFGTFTMGQAGGYEAVTLTTQNLPAHTHLMFAGRAQATASSPGSTEYLGIANGSDPTSGDAVTVQVYAPASGTLQPMADIGPAGGSQPVSVMQPYLVNNYCIAVQGIYPSRN